MTVHQQVSHRRPLDMAVYFITFALGVTTLAACSHALVARNKDIGDASNTAALGGISLIISTNPVTEPGYALSTASTGTFLNALILLVCSFKIPNFQRKIFFLLPIVAIFNAIFMIATSVAVFVEAKTGMLHYYATVKATGQVIPVSVIQAQATAIGLSNDFWGKDYVKFMAIVGLVAAFFSILNAICAYRFWRAVKAENFGRGLEYRAQGSGLDNVVSQDEKTGASQLEKV